MKQLQNNFTTPEQSKRLLELGVPADSADCFYEAIGFGGGYRQVPIICNSFNKGNRIDLPCWSVGRLIEIYCKVTGVNEFSMLIVDTLVEEIIYKISAIKFAGNLDFQLIKN